MLFVSQSFLLMTGQWYFFHKVTVFLLKGGDENLAAYRIKDNNIAKECMK